MTSPLTGVTGSTGTAPSSTPDSVLKQNTVDYNSFLQLLVQELKNQDPTQPNDPTQFLSQIASFSNVQQTAQTNSKLDGLLTTSALTQAESVIGKVVTSSDGRNSGIVKSVSLAAGGTATALLSNGKTITLDSTVSVSGA